MPGGAPFGNTNSAKGRRWADAVNRALERRSKADQVAELDRLAEVFLDTVEVMTASTEKRGPDIAGFKELADRLDGRATQALEHSGPGGEPLPTTIAVTLTKAPDA